MSKKPDGSKKTGKGNMGNKHSAVETQKKPEKVHGPKPNFAPKKAAVLESPQTDPMIIWKGWSGIVEIQGIRFRSSNEKLDNGTRVSFQVSVIAAPVGTELYGLAGSSVYVTVPGLHSPHFRSSMKEGSVDYKRQERLWNFLSNLFIGLGVKQLPKQKHPSVVTPGEQKKADISDSIDDLVSGVPGMYSFEKGGPRALFCVKHLARSLPVGNTVSGKAESKKILVVEIVSVKTGHSIHGYVRPGAHVHHCKLAWVNMPDFKGERAGDQLKIWEYLTDLIATHRKKVLGGESGIVNPDDCISGKGNVIYLANHQKAA